MLGIEQGDRRGAEKRGYGLEIGKRYLACAVALFAVLKLMTREHKYKRTNGGRHSLPLVLFYPMCRGRN